MLGPLGHSLVKARTKDVLIDDDVDFTAMLLPTQILSGLHNAGFRKPSPIQLKAVPLTRCGFDLTVQAKSGTGKTCVFTIAALETLLSGSCKRLQTIILAPTREIAMQITDVITVIGSHIPGNNPSKGMPFRFYLELFHASPLPLYVTSQKRAFLGRDVRAETFIGGMPLELDIKKAHGCQIAVGAPGRVRHLIEMDALATDAVRLFVLDEADKLMEKSYQKDINYIYSRLPESKQVMACSATYSAEMVAFLHRYMRAGRHVTPQSDPSPVLLGLRQFVLVSTWHPNMLVQTCAKERTLANLLAAIPFDQCIVYSNYHGRAESVCRVLCSEGWASVWMAGSQSQQQRCTALSQLRDQRARILVTTDLTARGIDAAHVDLVVNLDMPVDPSVYLHRMGRAGRFGASGLIVTLVTEGTDLTAFRKLLGRIGGCTMSVSRVPKEGASQLLWTQTAADFEQVYGIEPWLEAVTEEDNGGSEHTRNCTVEKSFNSVQDNGVIEDGENCKIQSDENCEKVGFVRARKVRLGEKNDNGSAVGSNGTFLMSYFSDSNDCNDETSSPTNSYSYRNNVLSSLDDSDSVSKEEVEAAMEYVDRDRCEAANLLDICVASWLKRSKPYTDFQSSCTDAANLRHDAKEMGGVRLFETEKPVCELDQTMLELMNCSKEHDEEMRNQSNYGKEHFQCSNEEQYGRVNDLSDFEKCINEYNGEKLSLEIKKLCKTVTAMNECAIKQKYFLKNLCDFEKSLSDYNDEIALEGITISTENDHIVNPLINFYGPQESCTDETSLNGISTKVDIAKSIIDFEKDLNEYADEKQSNDIERLNDVENVIPFNDKNEELIGKVKSLNDLEKSMDKFTDKNMDDSGHSKEDDFETHGNEEMKDAVKSLMDFENLLNEFAKEETGGDVQCPENLTQCTTDDVECPENSADKIELKDFQQKLCDFIGEENVQGVNCIESFIGNRVQDDLTVQTVKKCGQFTPTINGIVKRNLSVNSCGIGKQGIEIKCNKVSDLHHSVESADVINVAWSLNADLTENCPGNIWIGNESTVSKKSEETISLDAGNIPNQLMEFHDKEGNKEVDVSFIFEAISDVNKRISYKRRRNRNRKVPKPQNRDGIAGYADAVDIHYPNSSWHRIASANENQADERNTWKTRSGNYDEAVESYSDSNWQNVDLWTELNQVQGGSGEDSNTTTDSEEHSTMLNDLPSRGARRKTLSVQKSSCHIFQHDSVVNSWHGADVNSAHRTSNSIAEFKKERKSDGHTRAFQETFSGVGQEQCNRHCETCGMGWSWHENCFCNRNPSRHDDDAEEAISRTVCDNWYRIWCIQLAQIRSYVEYSKEFQSSFRE